MILLIHELIGFWHMKLFVFDYKSLFIDIVGFYTCVVVLINQTFWLFELTFCMYQRYDLKKLKIINIYFKGYFFNYCLIVHVTLFWIKRDFLHSFFNCFFRCEVSTVEIKKADWFIKKMIWFWFKFEYIVHFSITQRFTKQVTKSHEDNRHLCI